MIREANHDCILFANEYQQHCYIPHKESEEKSGDISWRLRSSLDINEYDARWSTRYGTTPGGFLLLMVYAGCVEVDSDGMQRQTKSLREP